MEPILQETNATVIAVYKSILQHNIAPEIVLEQARDYLNEWENATDKYPPISKFLYIAKFHNHYKTVENEWNEWTSGAFNEIFANTMRLFQQSDLKFKEHVRIAVSKLSVSTKNLFKNEYGEGLSQSSDERNQYTYLYKHIRHEILRNRSVKP